LDTRKVGRGRTRTLVRFCVVAAVMASTLAVTAAGADAVGHGYAYVWANDASSAIGVGYTPALGYQANSTGAQNTVTRTATGVYSVSFPGIGALGTATVSAYGTSGADPNARCKIKNWAAASAGVGTVLTVLCYSGTGSPVDSTFTALYTYVASSPTQAGYLWNDQPASTINRTVTPSRQYQFNSAGATNTVQRIGTGVYDVTLPRIGHVKGDSWHVALTAYGTPTADPSAFCSGNGDLSVASATIIEVTCQTATGAPVNSSFALTYVESNSLLLDPIGAHTAAYTNVGCDHTGGSVGPGSCSIATTTGFDTNPAADATIDVLGQGQYEVHLAVPLDAGDVQLTTCFTASDPTRGRCKIVFWNSFDGVRVSCVDYNGAPPSTATFLIAFVV
jgi:hypothetical protein